MYHRYSLYWVAFGLAFGRVVVPRLSSRWLFDVIVRAVVLPIRSRTQTGPREKGPTLFAASAPYLGATQNLLFCGRTISCDKGTSASVHPKIADPICTLLRLPGYN